MEQAARQPLITGDRIYLHRLSRADLSDTYLSWLNDPEVAKFSRRRNYKSTWADMEKFVLYAETCTDYHMAIRLKTDHRHIGNIAIDTIDRYNDSGEISIMLGERSVWNQGYGREAVQLATRFGFEKLSLRRLWAQSPNPSFNSIVTRLGWAHEGKRREAFRMGDDYIDLECWGILKHEFKHCLRSSVTV